MFKSSSQLLISVVIICLAVRDVDSVGPGTPDCREDYSPCQCRDFAVVRDVICRGVTMQDVRNVFNRTDIKPSKASYDSITLTLLSDDGVIPADLFAGNSVKRITINCPVRDYILKVDPKALTSSGPSSIQEIVIENCNASQLNWNFLTDLTNLTTLKITSSSNVLDTFATLPELPSLSVLIIGSSGLIDSYVDFPTLVNGLETFHLFNYKWSSDSANRIFDWILKSSRDTLRTMTIQGNNNLVMKIPKQIKSFTQLVSLDLSNNLIPVISAGSFDFTTLKHLELVNSGVKTIEPGAFQGDFKKVFISLNRNNLTRFDSSVFLDVLRDMEAFHSQTANNNGWASIGLQGNPIDCTSDPCHLAWLIHDNRRLMNHVGTATCSNGTEFSRLNQKAFDRCYSPTTNSSVDPINANETLSTAVNNATLTQTNQNSILPTNSSNSTEPSKNETSVNPALVQTNNETPAINSTLNETDKNGTSSINWVLTPINNNVTFTTTIPSIQIDSEPTILTETDNNGTSSINSVLTQTNNNVTLTTTIPSIQIDSEPSTINMNPSGNSTRVPIGFQDSQCNPTQEFHEHPLDDDCRCICLNSICSYACEDSDEDNSEEGLLLLLQQG